MWLRIVRHRTVRLQTKYTSFLLKVNLENAIIDKRILSICRRQPLRVARRRGRGAVNTFQLSCFLQVAETLNFARAAEILHVTQPAVTQQIRSLEKELGVPLFHRTTRSVKLTQAGAAFLSDAQQIVALSERAVRRFAAPEPDAVRIVTIGCASAGELRLLAPALRASRQAEPTFHPHLWIIPFRHIFRQLEEGDLDAVVTVRQGPRPRGVYRELARLPIDCLFPEGALPQNLTEVTPDDLAGLPLVLFTPERVMPGLAALQGNLVGERSPADLNFVESIAAMLVLVQAGYGAAMLPRGLAEPTPGVRTLPLAGAQAVSFGVYYRSLQGDAPLRAFVRALRESFAANGPYSDENA